MHMWGNYEQNHAQYQVSTKEGVSQVPVVHSGTVCGYAMLFCLCLVAHPYQLRYEVVCISPLFLSHSYLFLMHNCIRLSFNLFVSLNLHSRSWKRFEVMCLIWFGLWALCLCRILLLMKLLKWVGQFSWRRGHGIALGLLVCEVILQSLALQ